MDFRSILLNFRRDQGGSYTVEAVLIMSVIIVALTSFLFMNFLMYQKVLIFQAASRASQLACEIWSEKDGLYQISDDFHLGTYSLEEIIEEDGVGLEDYIEMTRKKLVAQEMTTQERKSRRLMLYISKMLATTTKKNRQTSVKITAVTGLLYKHITIEIRQKIRPFWGGLKEVFTQGETITIKAQASAVAADPVSFIRGLDYSMELVQRLKEY